MNVWQWIKKRGFWTKFCFIVLALLLLDHGYEMWMDATHEFRFKKYTSVEQATAELQRLYPKGTPIQKFQNDMESTGYRCKSGISDIAPYKGNPDTLYFMHCTWHHGFLYWAVWTAVAIYSTEGIINEVRTGHGWEGL